MIYLLCQCSDNNCSNLIVKQQTKITSNIWYMKIKYKIYIFLISYYLNLLIQHASSYFDRPVIYTPSSCLLPWCSPLIHTRSCLSRNSLSACTIFKTFKRMLETILPVSFMKWILLSLSNIRIIPKLVQTIPPFLGWILDRSQVMVTLPVLSLFTIFCPSLLTSWVTTFALFKTQNLISSNVPLNTSLFSQYMVSKISPFSVIRTHFARSQEDNNKSRFLYKWPYQGSPLYSLTYRNKEKNIIVIKFTIIMKRKSK